jgi:hypothetical protein
LLHDATDSTPNPDCDDTGKGRDFVPVHQPARAPVGHRGPQASQAAGFREHQFDTGSVRINYVVGPDNGRPLVLVPHRSGTGESYQRVLVRHQLGAEPTHSLTEVAPPPEG